MASVGVTFSSPGEAHARRPLARGKRVFPISTTIWALQKRAITSVLARSRPLRSPLFDADYYLRVYSDVAKVGADPLDHFLNYGWRECRDPNAWFSTHGYLQRHPELLETGEDPLSHLGRMARRARPTKATFVEGEETEPTLPLLSTLIAVQPTFPTKWRNNLYLARGLTEIERARSHLHTFVLLDAYFPPDTLQQLLLNSGLLWGSQVLGGAAEIRLALSKQDLNEGELCLSFTYLGRTLSILSFNVFPGNPIDRSDGDRLFISRMQTLPDGRAAARLVAKALGDVTPQAALFAAAQGLGQTLGITEFIGVPASRHVSLQPSAVARFANTYDLFFESVGGQLHSDGLYRGLLVGEERPIASIKAGHKIRTRHKRALKEAIRDCARAAIEQHKSY